MWLMLQQDQPDDFVLATNETHEVREFVDKAFAVVNRPIRWEGTEEETVGIDTTTNKVVVRVDPKYYRPTEVDLLWGDSTKAAKKLGWKRKVSFDELVNEMVVADVEMVRANRHDKN